MKKNKLNKHCKKCNKPIHDKNKSGYCNIHRDRTGKNNPFYGKSHTIETVNKLKIKCSIASRKKWEDDEYRKKVIDGISKPRREGFKKEQSERITQWYIDNPNQREIRSKIMKKSWENGIIISNNFSCNKSKKEKELFLKISDIFKEVLPTYTIKYEGSEGHKWIFPDIFMPSNNLVIEYYGNFWHANPKYYKAKDILHHNVTAEEIWKKDEKRIGILESLGYNIMIIWEDDFKEDSEKIIRLLNGLNWEACGI